MDHCDVLVVGGGPAGSSAAWRLGQLGMDVVVLDKARFPRDKTCAGWITPAVIETLALDLRDYRKDRTLQEIRRFRVGMLGGKAVCTRDDHRILSYGIRRCEFDHYLLQRSSARLRLGESLREMQRDGGGWVINGDLRARMVIGAGGHFCPIARHLGANPGRGEPAVVAQETEIALSPEQQVDCRIEPAAPEVYFCRDLQGYGWAFRKGHFLNIGLGRRDPERLSAHVAAFIETLVAQGKAPREPGHKLKGHAYLVYPHKSRPSVGDGVLLAGDAAGLAYPESGEGIRPAVESGLLAADVIAAADGRYDRERLARYEVLLTQRFGAREARSSVARLLPDHLKTRLAQGLLATEWFARRVVMDRWFLRTQVPVLPTADGSPPEPRMHN